MRPASERRREEKKEKRREEKRREEKRREEKRKSYFVMICLELPLLGDTGLPILSMRPQAIY
jgi:hypothetical protein